jgi:NhaP-type Na+/H+ or K+/H+ antiporter
LLAVVLLTFFNTSVSEYDSVLKAFVSSLSVGVVFGGVAAFILYLLLKRTGLIAEELRNLMVLAMIFVVFSVSNWVQRETGILAVTVAGFALGLLRPPGLRDIASFKGQLTTLMVSILFILLAAKLDLQAIWSLQLPGLIVLLLVLFVIRPLNVFISGINSQLNLREKIFISWVAPRGIVAAAVASLFTDTLRSNPAFTDQAGYIESLVFLVIGGTVFFQGATARIVGKLLKVTDPDPHGFVIIGANHPARTLARILKKYSIDAVLIDSNKNLVSKAKKEDLQARNANALSQVTIEDIELGGYGKLLAMTPSETVNILACQLWSHEFGKDNVFRIRTSEDEFQPPDQSDLSGEGVEIFPPKVSQQWLQNNLESAWKMETAEMSKKEVIRSYKDLIKEEEIIPLARIQDKKIVFFEDDIEITEDYDLIFLSKSKNKKGSQSRNTTSSKDSKDKG